MQSASRIPVFRNGKNPAKDWKSYSPRGSVPQGKKQINGSISKKGEASSIRKQNGPRTPSPQQNVSIGQGRHFVLPKHAQNKATNLTRSVSADGDLTNGYVFPRDEKRRTSYGGSPKTPSPQQGARNGVRNKESASNFTRSRSTSPRDSASRIPRFSPRRERSPSPGGHKVNKVRESNTKQEKDNAGTEFEEEDEFVRLEKMFAEEEKYYLKNHKNGDSNAGNNFIVEQIVEEVHEPFEIEEDRNMQNYSLEKRSVLSKPRNFSESPKRSLPSTPTQPILKNGLATKNSSSGKDNSLPIKESIKSNDYHSEILNTEKSVLYKAQQDNSATCKKIDNKIREGNLEYKRTPKKERLEHSRKEFTTVDDKETHYVLEDGILDQGIEINAQNSKRQADFKDKFINISNKSSASYSQHKASDVKATGDHVSVTAVTEKGNSTYRVLGDVYELNDVMKVPLLDTEADIKFPDDKELPSYESLPHAGTVDYYAFDELRYATEEDETTKNTRLGREPNLNDSNVPVFGQRSKKWDFPSHFLEDGALLTDIEEEKTADMLPTSSLYSYRADTDEARDADWEEETIPPDSKRGSLDSISFSVSIKPLTQSKTDVHEVYNSHEEETDDTQDGYCATPKSTRDEIIERIEVVTEYINSSSSHPEISARQQKEESSHTVKCIPNSSNGHAHNEARISSSKGHTVHTTPSYKSSKTGSKTDTTMSPNLKSKVGNDIIEDVDEQFVHEWSSNGNSVSPTGIIKDDNENITYSYIENSYEIDNTSAVRSKKGFEPMTIGTIRPSDEDDSELKLSSRHSLAFGEMNPIKIECVKLCRSRSLKAKDDESENRADCDATSNVDSGELEAVKVELKKMNMNISGLQKELHTAKEKVIKLRSGLAMIRQNRLLWKRCIQRTKS